MTDKRHIKRRGVPVPFNQWPEPDRDAWNCAISPGDVFTDAGSGAHWRPATRKSYIGSYGRWLAFLKRTQHLDPKEAPAARVSRERTGAYIGELQTRLKPVSVWSYISDLHNMLYRMFPEEDWAWLRLILNRLHEAVPRYAVTADQLLPIDDLYHAGCDLMADAERERDRPYRPGHDSVHYRDGLMLTMLAVTLLRVTNFASLRIGIHLTRQSEGYVIAIPKDEVKNRQPIEIEIPDALTALLDRYLEHHRPRLLMEGNTDYLWISLGGQAMRPHRVSQRVSRLTERHLGKRISPHRFRHAAATSIATVSPELARIIRPLLGHTKITTSEQYYNRATMMDASRRHADVIATLRSSLQDQLADKEFAQ